MILDTVMSFKLSKADKRVIERLASRERITASSYVRNCVLSAKKNTDLQYEQTES